MSAPATKDDIDRVVADVLQVTRAALERGEDIDVSIAPGDGQGSCVVINHRMVLGPRS